MCAKRIIFFWTALLCIYFTTAQTAVYNISVGNLHKMQTGIGWPDSLTVVDGHEALLKLSTSFESQACVVTTPAGEEFDVQRPSSSRYESWTDSCGVRVKNVTVADNGRWRLTAARGTDTVTGWTEVHVEENIDQYQGTPITLRDGQTHATVDLSTLSNSYCLVAQPFSESSLVPGHCSITLDRTTRAVQGNWHVWLGLPGRVSELQVDRRVAVESERLDVGFVRETNPRKLHLYCNILHTVKNVTFCRFQKTSARSGFNVMDGLSDGSYSYYGEGFAKRQCGMTIENPDTNDYGTWKCTVGVQEWVNNKIEQKTPMQALVRVSASRRIQNNFRETSQEGTIFVQRDTSFTISCQAEMSLAYCWFQHPNGTQFTPVASVDDSQLFWYTGESLQTGDCGITFTHASDEESGPWTCHMGPRDQTGVEITDTVTVRVTGPLAASDQEIMATIGGKTTLYCHTSNGNRPLDYCRFLSPNYVGISIDSSVTEENAILGRFYFTPDRELNYGDCSLSINPVLQEDVGEWTCAALVDEESMESRDTIILYTQAVPPTFRAGVVGMSIGLSFLILTLAGVLLYKNREKIANIPFRRTANTQRTDSVSLSTRSNFGSDISSPRSSEQRP